MKSHAHEGGPFFPFNRNESRFAPDVQLGYNLPFAGGDWLAGLKFDYKYANIHSRENVSIPQSGTLTRLVGPPLTENITGFVQISPASAQGGKNARISGCRCVNRVPFVSRNRGPQDLGTGSKTVVIKPEAIRDYFENALLNNRPRGATLAQYEAMALSDAGVVVTGLDVVTGVRDGTPVSNSGRVTFVVAKRESDWKIVHFHRSAMPK